MMKRIILPVFDITVDIDIENGSGIVTSSLGKEQEDNEDWDEKNLYFGMINTLHSMILSCACAGIDIESPKFLEAIETTANAIENQFC